MDKGKEFRKSLQVEPQIAEFMTKESKKQKETYTASKGTMKKAKRKVNWKNTCKLIGEIGLAGLLAFGGYKACQEYNEYKSQNTPITLEQAMKNGESLDELGIDKKIEKEIEDINNLLNKDEITNNEIIELSAKINNLQFDTIKTKLSNTLGVDEEDIKVFTDIVNNGETTEERIEIKGGKIYTNKDFFKNSDTMTEDISNFIKDIGKIQGLMGDIQNKNMDRRECLKKYKQVMKNLDNFAAGKMTIDDKGNISMDYTKVSELDKEETKAVASSNYEMSQEIEDEER